MNVTEYFYVNTTEKISAIAFIFLFAIFCIAAMFLVRYYQGG